MERLLEVAGGGRVRLEVEFDEFEDEDEWLLPSARCFLSLSDSAVALIPGSGVEDLLWICGRVALEFELEFGVELRLFELGVVILQMGWSRATLSLSPALLP